MSVYTVYEPPLRAADALADPQRFVFVRDGFYVWAFLLTPLWMIRHRLWLVLLFYLFAAAGIDAALRALGASPLVVALVAVLISLLIGLEGATLRRVTLERHGWRNIGVVSGDRAQDAEWRYFNGWVRQAPARPVPAPQVKPTASAPSPPAATGVIGLFPESGAQR
jgi:hypothetical protein